MKQAYNTAIRATSDKNVIREILNRTAQYVQTIDLDSTPADASNFVYRITREITGIEDPYKEEKDRYNRLCLEKTPYLRKKIAESDNPFKTAARVAILGNIIDLGIGLKFDLDRDIETLINADLTVDDVDTFQEFLGRGRKKILYLGDNAGEIVFDMLLCELLSKDHDITFVVKSGPIINDATMEDAEFIGLTKLVKVIETGSNGIGVKWDEVSDEFLRHYNETELIISKGQGNFETMSDKDKNTYFLLKAKCDSVADMLGVKFGDIVFKKGPVYQKRK